MLLSHALLFLLLCTGGILGSAVFHRRFEETLPLTFGGIVAVLYGFGLAGQLKMGFYAVCLLCAGLYLFSLAYLFCKHEWKHVLGRFFTPGFVIFVALFGALTYLNNGRVSQEWDDFSHWADIVKVMTHLDAFGTHPLSRSGFPNYLPGMSLFQYFVQKLMLLVTPDALFSEWRLFFSYQLAALSFFFPFLREVKFRKVISCGIVFGALCLSPLIFCPRFFKFLTIDPFIAIVAGSGFAWLYEHPQQDRITRCLLINCVFMLVLAKDMGFLFAAALAAVVLSAARRPLLKQRRYYLSILMILFWLAVPKLLWNLHVDISGVQKNFNASVDLGVLLNLLLGRDPTYRAEVLSRYARAIFTNTVVIGQGFLQWQPTYFVIFLLLLAGVVVIDKVFGRCEKQEARSRRITLGTVVFSVVIYVVSLGFLYAFKFSEYEALRLASHDRYLSTPIITLITMILLLIFSRMIRSTNAIRTGVLLLLCIALALPVAPTCAFFTREAVATAQESRTLYLNIIQYFQCITDEEKDIFVVSQKNSEYDGWVLRYTLRPHRVEFASLSTDGPLYDGDIWTAKKSCAQWQEELKNYDYVALFRLDDTFIENYGALFANPDEITYDAIFEVNHEDGLLYRC